MTCLLAFYPAMQTSASTQFITTPSSYDVQVSQLIVPADSTIGDVIYKRSIDISYRMENKYLSKSIQNGQPIYLHSFFGQHSFACGGTILGVNGIKWRMRFANSQTVTCGTSGNAIAINQCGSGACIAKGKMTIELYLSGNSITTQGKITFPSIRFSAPMRWLGDDGQGFRLKAENNILELASQDLANSL